MLASVAEIILLKKRALKKKDLRQRRLLQAGVDNASLSITKIRIRR